MLNPKTTKKNVAIYNANTPFFLSLFFFLFFAWPGQKYALVECNNKCSHENHMGSFIQQVFAVLPDVGECTYWCSHFLQVWQTELENPLLIRSIQVNKWHYCIYSHSITIMWNMKKIAIFVHHVHLRTKYY